MLHCIRYVWCVAPIFLLAGCWQKIEYKGKPIAAAKAPANSTEATTAATESKPVEPQPLASPPVNATAGTAKPEIASGNGPVADNIPPAAPAAETRPVAATPIPSAATSPSPASPSPRKTSADDDRYATPPQRLELSTNSKSVPPEIPKASAPESAQPKRHTDATPVSATVDVVPKAMPPKIRRAVWILGSRLSLAALARDRRMAENSVPVWFDEAQSACKVLGTSVAQLPEPAAENDRSLASQEVIRYLLDQGQRIGRDLAKRYGPEQSALFEVALKSNILLLLYSPGSDATNSIAAAISRAAPQAQLPPELWKPLLERIERKSSLEDVRTAVRQMHKDVDNHLASAEPKGQ
jgi:hypothetical protein